MPGEQKAAALRLPDGAALSMKTLIFCGSPHPEGSTSRYLDQIAPLLDGEVERINIFEHLDCRPCMDCGYCQRHPGCVLHDYFSEALEKIMQADCYILAFPLWFGNIPGPVLQFFSRLQTITSGLIFRKDIHHQFDKAAVILMTSDEKWHGMSKNPEMAAEFITNHFDALILDSVLMSGLGKVPAFQSRYDLLKCRQIAEEMNTWMHRKESGAFSQYGYASENSIRMRMIDEEESSHD